MANYSKSICSSCGKQIRKPDGHPYCVDDCGNHYCLGCGLRLRLIDPLEYLKLHGIGIFHHAVYEDGWIKAFRKWGKGYRMYELKFKES